MFTAILRTSLQDSVRGEDRARPGADAPRETAGGLDAAGRPPVLRRRTIRLLAVIGILAILYGSLAPFRIDPHRTWSWELPFTQPVPGDFGCNILLYIPIGLLGRLLVRRRGSHALGEWCFALLLGGALSYAAEVTQSVLVARVTSLTDWMCNVGGAAIGALLAPLAQRMLRNQHAWLYAELRVRPFTAAAVAGTILAVFAGLVPFDFRLSPGRLVQACEQFLGAAATSPQGPVQGLDKLLAAGAFGALALLTLLAGREAGRSVADAGRWAMKKTALLATGIEALQLLTVSHSARAGDLLLAWVLAAAGVGVGMAWLLGREGRLPRAVSVARLLVAGGIFAVLARTVVGVADGLGGGAAFASWLPMSGQFERPWGSLLGTYINNLAYYTLAAGLMVLWYRASGVRPRPAAAILGAALPVLFAAWASVYYSAGFDTAQLILALVAGFAAIAADRALFPPALQGGLR